ncbi:hypothetical protein FOA52_013524 [Chlamydomonas sp. UWO 241]|nr:hypothetical protein FOA52_013524 [Chlamydomonas sp. UWO 241]
MPPASTRLSGLSTGPQLLGVAPPARLRVAVDIDEVLGRFLVKLNEYYEQRYGRKYAVEDFYIYEFAKVWNCSQEVSNKIVYEFFQHPMFRDEGIPVIPGALESLRRMSESVDLVVVTSRQHAIQGLTLDWINRHYPGIFQEVYFGNHWALEGTPKKKSQICRSIGAKLIIDDNPGYALDCAHAGIHVLLYDWENNYPWSKIPAEKMHPLITVVSDWSEVERTVLALAPRLASSPAQTDLA